jgi:K+-transporting ATPase ATPase C chain
MTRDIRAILWLLVLTILLCSVAYPLALLGVGQTLFPNRASGSLVNDRGEPVADGEQARGSVLIAQAFTGDEYFHPRPSAASYNGAASAASNWGANNYLLRDRVARAVGPVVKYRGGDRKGKPVAPDVVAWFRQTPGVVAEWAGAHSGLAQAWVKADEANAKYVEAWWAKRDAAEAEKWKKDNPNAPEPTPVDLAGAFFESFSKDNPGAWLKVTETKSPRGETSKQVELVKPGDEDAADIAAVFFDMWRAAHPNADLEPVPADLVMASGSGLDPHITLANALYQLDRVAAKRAADTGRDVAKVRVEIEEVLRRNARAPLGGLAGVEQVNVLEVNLILRGQ